MSIALGLDKQVGTISIHSEQPRYDVHIGVGLAFIDCIVAHGESQDGYWGKWCRKHPLQLDDMDIALIIMFEKASCNTIYTVSILW